MKKGDIIKLSYTGRISGPDTVFDTTDAKVAEKEGIKNNKMAYGPVTIIVGETNLIKGVEEAIESMKEGEEKTIEIPPEKAYGKRDPNRIVVTPLKEFKARNITPYPGMVIQTEEGYARVQSVNGGRVRLDFNHELAGKTLKFTLKVEKLLKEPKEQIEGLLEAEFPGIPAKEIEIAVGKDSVTITTTPAVEMANGSATRKKNLADKILKHIKGIKRVIYKQEFSKE